MCWCDLIRFQCCSLFLKFIFAKSYDFFVCLYSVLNICVPFFSIPKASQTHVLIVLISALHILTGLMCCVMLLCICFPMFCCDCARGVRGITCARPAEMEVAMVAFGVGFEPSHICGTTYRESSTPAETTMLARTAIVGAHMALPLKDRHVNLLWNMSIVFQHKSSSR